MFLKASAKDGRGPDWWINLERVAAVRVAEVTVRGHTGRAALDTEVSLFRPVVAPNGDPVIVRAYGLEAEAILDAVERRRTAA